MLFKKAFLLRRNCSKSMERCEEWSVGGFWKSALYKYVLNRGTPNCEKQNPCKVHVLSLSKKCHNESGMSGKTVDKVTKCLQLARQCPVYTCVLLWEACK